MLMTCVRRLALIVFNLAILGKIICQIAKLKRSPVIMVLHVHVCMLDYVILCSCCDYRADVHSAVVSGWRLIDGAPYWAPKLGQEGLLNKVRSIQSGHTNSVWYIIMKVGIINYRIQGSRVT